MRQLIADKEDTAQVFRIVKALSGNSYYRNFNRFMKSSDGRRIASDRADLLETLCDRKRLATCASGTLGRAYLDFVYGEGLTAEGLAEASEAGGLEDLATPMFPSIVGAFAIRMTCFMSSPDTAGTHWANCACCPWKRQFVTDRFHRGVGIPKRNWKLPVASGARCI